MSTNICMEILETSQELINNSRFTYSYPDTKSRLEYIAELDPARISFSTIINSHNYYKFGYQIKRATFHLEEPEIEFSMIVAHNNKARLNNNDVVATLFLGALKQAKDLTKDHYKITVYPILDSTRIINPGNPTKLTLPF